MKLDNRTIQQNKAYFLFHQWIAEEMNSQGITLDKLVLEIQPRATKENLHDIFKAILEKMYWKTSTKWMTREEMNSCLDVYLDALASIGIVLEFPDWSRKSLLEFYL